MPTWSPVNTYHHEEDCKMKTLCQLHWRKELAQSQCHISGRKLLIPPRCIVPVHRYVPVHSTRAIQYHGYFRQVLLIFIFFSLISFFFLSCFSRTATHLHPVETGLDAVSSALGELSHARLDLFHGHRARHREWLHHKPKNTRRGREG